MNKLNNNIARNNNIGNKVLLVQFILDVYESAHIR